MLAIEDILERFRSGQLQHKKSNEIARLLGVGSRGGRDELFRLLKNAESEGLLVRDERGRYVTPEKLGLIRGTVQGNERGFGFLLREDGGVDLFLPHHALHGALHGDRVFARLVGGERGDEGSVYCVLSRGMRTLTGTYSREHKGGFVEPDERRFAERVRVVGGLRAADGEKVLVKLVAYPDGHDPEGEIVEVLGKSGDLAAEVTAIIRSQNLKEEFPQKALTDAQKSAGEPVLLGGRRDFRGDTVITIDGDDSRDFDDAVNVTRSEGGYRLCVHIADVTHYVARGGAADKEAYERGTSVYFPERVLPMLPESLSNGACSLNEGEDRYTMSCVMQVDGHGKVTESEIVRGVIRSCARMTYTKVTGMLEGDEALRREYAAILPMCEDMRDLAEILMKKRAARGSIDLDVPEPKITVHNGQIAVAAAERGIAHHIIEEFMILANETVATFAAGYDLPFVYRIHEKPTEERAASFQAYLRELGVEAKFRPDNVRPGEYGRVLALLEGKPLRGVVNTVMLRSMSKARYSPENKGHFGLASKCYCHFTSPIRRYPDLIVHRILGAVLDGEAAGAEESFGKFVAAASVSCSESERRADEAERAVDDLYKVWYMRSHLGEEFDGTVTGVTAFGVFVGLANTVEGLIRLENLPEDEYEYIEERYLLKGKKHSFTIGDALRIKVAACDVGTRRIEFVPAAEQ